MSQPLLYGLHDRQAAPHVPDGGWCVDTIALSENPAPFVYDQRINWIVRVNWGYGSTGTIPLPKDDNLYLDRLAHYVHNSKGAIRWIIGNEPNHEQERPDGVYITPERYASFFVSARTLIKAINSDYQVIPAPCAPYHASPIDWLRYWCKVLELLGPNGCDGLAIHAYTRSSNPADIANTAKMGPPLEGQSSGFYTYLDACVAVPANMEYLPVYITEFNELLPEGWHDANTGVVQAAYADVHDSNSVDPEVQPIMCLILYRWPKFDKWHIEGKQGVIDDFRAAVAKGYTSPPVSAQSQPKQEVHLPSIGTGQSAQATLPERQWDERLTQRGVTIETPTVAPGQQFWRIVKARWWNEQEADAIGPDHHILADVLDSFGKRVGAGVSLLVQWPGDHTLVHTEAKPGEPWAANFPMTKSLNEFSIQMNDPLAPSETLKGIGMGADGNSGIHTSTGVVFQLVTMPATTTPTQPTPEPVPIEQPVPMQDNWVTEPIGARIRKHPVNGEILTAVPYGERVDVVGIDNTSRWRHVRWNGIDGWMSPNLLRNKRPAPSPLPAPEPAEPQPIATGIIDPLTALAFLQVESNNKPFTNGLLTIRFEVHRFKANLKNDALFDKHFKFTPGKYDEQYWRPTPDGEWQHAHGNMVARHKLLDFARTLNQKAALLSTGMGMAQVMGEGHLRVGYSSVQAMYAAFSHPVYGVNSQVMAFVNYCLSDPALLIAMREMDFLEMTQRYNGVGQENIYVPALQKALAQIRAEIGG